MTRLALLAVVSAWALLINRMALDAAPVSHAAPGPTAWKLILLTRSTALAALAMVLIHP